MGKLLQLIAKLFGKNAISKTLGTRTNVIKLPSNEKKRLIKDELNIEAASDLAAQKVLKEAEDLIADIPKMNDQEVLTFTGNLQRLDNKLNPPSAEVLDLTTKKPVTGEGLEQLAARDGLPADVSPDSPIGRVMQGAQRLRKEKDELDKMLKDPAKQLEQEMQNPYRSGGPLDPKMGIVRTAARQVLQKLAREGKINIADEREAKAIIEGYQGGVDPIEVFRKTFGQDALGDLANLGDELLEIDNRGGSFKDIKKILDDEGFFDLQQPKNPVQGRTDEELMKLIKDEDPEKFATGGRVGFEDGGYTFEQFLKDKQQVDKFMSIEELKREYKRMMELKKIRDQRDMVATGGRVGFDDGGILSLEEAKKLNPGMFVDTTTYNPIPENAPNMAADEIAKVIMGTGFLPEEDNELGYPEGMEKPMSSKLFIFEEYVIPQRKKMMENFGLTLKEADDLIRQEMEKYRTNKATGGRVGFQIGGPAYDATNPIYGSSAITVTPDTIMGPQGKQIQAQTGVNPALQRSQNPFQNLGFLNTQKHFDQNQLLKNAVASGEITPEQYNELGGYDVTQTMAAGNPIMGGIGNLLGSTAYNVVQSLKGDQPFSDIPGDVYRNVKGGMGLISDDLKSKYESIINQQQSNVIPNFEKLSDGSYRDTRSGDIYGSETYGSIAAGMYPDIYNPNQQTTTPMAGYGTTYKWDSNTGKYNLIDSQARKGQGLGFMTAGEYGDPMYGKILGLNPDNTLSIIGDLGKANTLSKEDYEYYNPNNTYGDLFNFYNTGPGYASGGRVGYAYGSGLKLAQLLQKAGKSLKQAIKEAVDNINPTGDKKLDADMAVDDMLETYSIDRDAVDGYDILNAYDEAYKTIANPKTMSEVETLEAMGANITAKTLELVEKYPGLNSELARKIASDPDPQRQAEVISTIEQAFELMKQGKSSDEVLDIMKQMTDRTKQAGGGLSYLSGF